MYRLYDLSDGFVLTVDLSQQSGGECLQLAVVLVVVHREGIDLTGLCQHVGNLGLRHGLLFVFHFYSGSCLVDEVDGLVGQESVVHMLIAGIDGEVDGCLVVGHPVELLILLTQLAQDMLRLLGCRLGDVDLLEAAHEALRTREVAVVFLVGGGADEADAARLEVGLQHVGGIHRSLACGTGSHECVDLVDIDDVLLALLLDAVHDLFDAVLEVAPILGACQQGTDVELVDATAFEAFRHATFLYQPGEAPYQRGLTHTGLSDVQGVVLVATAEHLDGALQLLFAAYQRVVVLVEVVHAGDQFAPGGLGFGFACIGFEMVVEFVGADEFADEVALHIAECLLQQVARPRVGQMQDAHDEVGQVEGLRTTVEHLLTGIFYHLGHLGRGLGLIGLILGDGLYFFQLILQIFCQRAGRVEDAERVAEIGLFGQHQQQVFGHHELVAVFPAALHRLVEDADCTLCLFDLCHITRLMYLFATFGFYCQAKGESCLARQVRGLPHLRGGHIVAVDAHYGLVGVVNLEHQRFCLGLALQKYLGENHHDKLHRSEVVVVDGHLIPARLPQICALPFSGS